MMKPSSCQEAEQNQLFAWTIVMAAKARKGEGGRPTAWGGHRPDSDGQVPLTLLLQIENCHREFPRELEERPGCLAIVAGEPLAVFASLD